MTNKEILQIAMEQSAKDINCKADDRLVQYEISSQCRKKWLYSCMGRDDGRSKEASR